MVLFMLGILRITGSRLAHRMKWTVMLVDLLVGSGVPACLRTRAVGAPKLRSAAAEARIPGEPGAAGRCGEAGSRMQGGFTLMEVVMSLAIVTFVFGGILTAYIQTGRQAEWSGYSLAAQAIGVQQIEQARSAVWDTSISKNELTNMNLVGWTYNTGTKVGTGRTTTILDLPISGTNVVMATNFVTLKMLNLTGVSNVQVQMVIVDTVWPILTLRGTKLYTNRTASYFGQDNRDASSL
jgi:prepilin-type N-terminal cleavage/methylation domain-containing protein